MDSKVLPADSPLVARYLKDFRVRKGNTHFAAHVLGEGKFASTVLPDDKQRVKQVLVEFLPEASWKKARPRILVRWLVSFRMPYLAFSLLPLLLAFCAYHQGNRTHHLFLGLLVLAATGLLHIGCNLWSDYEDHLRGVDSPSSSGGSGVIRKLWIPAVHVRNGAAIFFLLGFALGLALLFLLPWQNSGRHLLWIGLLGSFSAASYSGWPFHYKYLGLGEPVIFLVSGPLIAMGACAIFFQDPGLFLWFSLVSLPLSFLAILRLHAGNILRIPFDTMARTRTIANLAGFNAAKNIYLFLLFAPYLCLLTLLFTGIAPRNTAVAFLSFPLLITPIRTIRAAKGPLDPLCNRLRSAATSTQILFGVLYCLGFLL